MQAAGGQVLKNVAKQDLTPPIISGWPSSRSMRFVPCSPRCAAHTTASRWPTSTAPAARRCPAVGRRRDARLPPAPQRQHALGLPDQRRDRRADRRRPRGARRLPRRLARRDRLRRQHDDAHVPPRARARARLAAGRRGHRHRTRPPRQRRSVARGGARRRPRRAHRAVRRRDAANSTGPRSSARSRRGRGCWPSAPRRTRWARSTTSPPPRASRTRPARSASWTPSTTRAHELVDVRAIGCDVLVVLAVQVLRAARGRAVRAARPARSGSTCRSSRPRPTTRRSASRPGRCRTRRSSARRRRSTSWPPRAGRRVAPRRRWPRRSTELHARGQRQVTRLWEGLGAIPGVTIYGPPPSRPRTSTLSFVMQGRTSTEVAAPLVVAGAVRVERRLLRADGRRAPRPRGRRARADRLRGLHDRRRGGARDRRPSPRSDHALTGRGDAGVHDKAVTPWGPRPSRCRENGRA